MTEAHGIIRPHHPKLLFLLRIADAACITASLFIACTLYPEKWQPKHTIAAALAIVLFSFVAESTSLYRAWRGAPMKRELMSILTSWAAVLPVLLLAGFISKSSHEYSRFIMLVWFGITPVLLCFWRGTLRFALQEARQRGRNTRSVAIVGVSPMAEHLARTILETPWSGMRIVGFFDDRKPARLHQLAHEVGVIKGDLDTLVKECTAGRIDLVYVSLPLRAEPRINSLVKRLADTTASVYVVADFFVFDLLRAQWTSVGDIPVVSIFETPFYGVDGWVKRVEDIVLGSIILALAAIPMLLIALGVKLTSKGPALFHQRRYGLNGEVIDVLKFRSMTVCEDGAVVKQAVRDDPRVTRFGAFLRRTSLDELPQFLHVITGKMSIVGPRPHAVAHNEAYRKQIHGYMLRHKVKPGITGWAQVNGWRGETDTLDKMEKRIAHDLAYIRNWGLWLDLKIIALTVVGAAKSRNAY